MKKTQVAEFQQFVDFAFNDINNSINKASANLLCALGLVCYTEYIGRVINDEITIDGNVKKNFEEGLFSMGEGYRQFDELLIKRSGISTYKLFRCGLVHRYYTRQLSVVAANTKNPKSTGLGFNRNNTPGIAITNYSRDLKKLAESLL